MSSEKASTIMFRGKTFNVIEQGCLPLNDAAELALKGLGILLHKQNGDDLNGHKWLWADHDEHQIALVAAVGLHESDELSVTASWPEVRLMLIATEDESTDRAWTTVKEQYGSAIAELTHPTVPSPRDSVA